MNLCTTARCACVLLTSVGLGASVAAQSISATPAAASAQSERASPAGQADERDDAGAQAPESQVASKKPTGERSPLTPFLGHINDTGEGWTARVDRIVSGGGLALGQAYTHRILGGQAQVRADMLASFKGYVQSELSMTSRPLGAAGLTFGGRIRYQNLPQEDFFGMGQGSASSMHTSYTRETTDVSLVSTLGAASWLRVDGVAGFLGHEISRGRQGGLPSTEEYFPGRVVPGSDNETEFLHAGVTATMDLRDAAAAPRRGGWYTGSLTHYEGISGSDSSFSQVEADLRQYLPIPGTTRHGLALRSYLVSTIGAGDADIPFFMLPRLGGRSSLRGYEVSRYTDRHALAFSVEHRWDVHPKIQLVGFVDAGQVSSALTNLQIDRFHTSVGAGARYRIHGSTAISVDFATGQEGPRWHIGFGPSF